MIVGLSGLPGAHHHWRWLATPLFTWARFIRLELPGFGEAQTKGRIRPLPLRARGELVARALETLGVSDVSLVAHSMGGVVALETAVHHAPAVQSVTLVATPGPTPHYSMTLWKALASVMTAPPIQATVPPLLRWAYERMGFSVRDMLDEGALRTLIDVAAIDFERHRQNIASIRAHVMHTWADDDRFVPRSFHEALASMRPDFTRLRFHDGGHDIQKSHGVELATAMREMIERTAHSLQPSSN